MKQEKRRKTIGRRLAAALLCTVLFTGSLTGCGSDLKIVLTTGFAGDEVFRIGKASCTTSEIMVYLTNMQNQYEASYGSEIWNTAGEGQSLEESVKEQVLAQVAQIKAMTLLAKEKEISLDENEIALTEQAGERYFSSLNDTEKEKLQVTQDEITKMYQEYALAEKVYHEIIRDINPEISDDEARKITVQSIFLKTWYQDADGNRMEMSSTEKEEVRNRAETIREKAVNGTDFSELANQYSEGSASAYSFGKGEMEEAVETAAFNLEKDEISQVIEGEDGFYIIQCLNTLNREETDANKLKIMEERRNEAFNEEYGSFVQEQVRRLNEELWQSLRMIHDEAVTTDSFYQVYDQIFNENPAE